MLSPLNYFKKSPINLDESQLKLSFYELPCPKQLDGTDFDLSSLKGKVVIVCNTASKCGYTDGHYVEFAELYSKYHDMGLEILGFPCGQFNNQEHQDTCDIRKRADNAKVTFPLFERVDVNGPTATPIFQWLKLKSGAFGGPKNVSNIGWNFGKFLLNKQGEVVRYAGPNTSPKKMTADIEKELNSQ